MPRARIRGIAVSIAARMEQAARPAPCASATPYAQVRGMFEVDAQEPLSAKGVDVPVTSYLVRRANRAASASARAGSKCGNENDRS